MWGVGGGVPMWDEETSSLENVYLSKQYTNIPDNIIKQLQLKQVQVAEIAGMWTKFPGTMWKFRVNNRGYRNRKRKRNKPFCRHKHLFLLHYQYSIISDKNARNISHISQTNSFRQILKLDKTMSLSIQKVRQNMQQTTQTYQTAVKHAKPEIIQGTRITRNVRQKFSGMIIRKNPSREPYIISLEKISWWWNQNKTEHTKDFQKWSIHGNTNLHSVIRAR